MRVVFLFTVTIGWAVVALSQTTTISFENTQSLDPSRYDGIKGSPMYFDDWVTGDLLRNDGAIYEDVQLNYNGHTGYIEVKAEDKWVELPIMDFLRAQVNRDRNPLQKEAIQGDFIAFQRNIAPRFEDRFVVLLFVSGDIVLFKDFSVRVAKHTVQDVGRSVDFERFDINSIYYLKEDGKVTMLKLRRKSLEEAMSSADVGDFMKDMRIDPRSETDLIELVQHYAEIRDHQKP